MDIDVIKFGGSSLSNNLNLNIAANKILKIKSKNKSKIVVIVSAQGSTTNELLKEAKELAAYPNKRELDALLSIGEQKSASKLAIILTRMGYKAISLNAMQIGIFTDDNYNNSKITYINKNRIINELKNDNIVIITGFQGIDKNNNFTTLGRGGSDTTAVAIASVLNANNCFICSDVDGIYDVDPKKYPDAKCYKTISYNLMETAAFSGAKVMHERCINIARKSNLNIRAISTFNDNDGTIIKDEIEKVEIKNIVKNDSLLLITISINNDFDKSLLIEELIKNSIKIEYIKINKKSVLLVMNNMNFEEFKQYIEEKNYKFNCKRISKITYIGNEIQSDKKIMQTIFDKLMNKNKLLFFTVDNIKITFYFKEII